MMAEEVTQSEAKLGEPLVILNSNANMGRTGSLATTIRDALKRMNSRAEVIETRSQEEGRRAIEAAIKQERPVVVCGGDGTVRAAASIILDAGSKVPLGIVPAGTGNDFAWGTLDLPRDPVEALRVALSGTPRPIDAIRVNDEWATNIFAAGLGGNVAWDVQEMVKAGRPWARGPARYTISILRQIFLFYNRLPVLDITIDGQRWGKAQMLTCFAMVGPTSGGGYKVAPDADPYDGRLDLVLMRRMSRFGALRVLPMTKNGTHTRERDVQMLLAQEVAVHSDRPIQAHVDGDPVQGSSFSIRVVPGAFVVMRS
jgi:diacylglycerol kinase (ATP)